MASHIQSLFGSFCLGVLLATTMAMAASFSDLFQPAGCPADHIKYDGGSVGITLDQPSGCLFESKNTYSYGQVSMQIKVIPGDSAGVITSFFMSSEGSNGANRDELDLEFMGNVSGQPYLLQTNLWINGVGNREQRNSLWFDPRDDFHTYTISWNANQIRFLVDGTPIRVYTNQGGIPYPTAQAMKIYGCIWNGEEWATQEGRVKTNWNHAPFVSYFKGFDIQAAQVTLGQTTDDVVSKAQVEDERS